MTYSHEQATYTYIRAQPFPYPGTFPEDTQDTEIVSYKSSAWGCATYPFLFLSIIPGNSWWAYALVQMRRRNTSNKDRKLKRAVYFFVSIKFLGLKVSLHTILRSRFL